MSTKAKRLITLPAAGALLVLAALAVAGCGGGGSSNASSGPPKTASGAAATVGVSNEGLGNILVNSKGRTLYLFSRDSGTTSECSGACAVNWPPLRVTGKPTIGSGAKASLIATTTRSDGARQVTYNGHPLYLFKGDGKAGDTKGEALNAFGGNWYALSAVIIPGAIGYAFGGVHTMTGCILFSGLFRSYLMTMATSLVNSVCHSDGRYGYRRFDLDDGTTNEFVTTILTFGEGLHNNHHRFPRDAYISHAWYEIDINGLIILGLGKLGLVHDIFAAGSRTPRSGDSEDGKRPVADTEAMV